MDLNKIMDLGYSDKEAFIICRYLKYHKMSIKTFVERFSGVYSELEKLNFNESEIKLIILLEPRIVCCIGDIENRINNMKKNILRGDKTDINVIARAIIFKEETVNNKYDSLIKLGFKKDQVKHLLARDPKFITRSAKTIKDCFDFFVDIGITKSKVINIFLDHSKIICKNNNLLVDNFKKLMDYGFTKEEATTLVSNLPTILFTYLDSVGTVINLLVDMGLEDKKTKEKILSYTSLVTYKKENYKKLRKSLRKKGLTNDEIDYITIKAPEIITYVKNVINYLYEKFYTRGYKNNEINQILIKNPKILYHKLEKIEDVLTTLESFGIKKEDLIKITINYPMIFESSIESLKEKISLIFKLDLYDSILKNPKNLIQGSEKTFLRYCYALNEMEKEIDLSNDRLIFASNPKEMPKIEVLKHMYSYNHFKDNCLENRLKTAKEEGIKVKCLK